MAKYKCPSCGEFYNGKKCRNCLYEHFTEEIAHGNHTHEGEPLVIDTPVRKPLPRKNPFGCEARTRKKNPTAVFVLLLAILNFLMPVLGNLWNRLESAERPAASIIAAPEPEPLPENLVTLHQEGPIHIFTTASELQHFADSFTIYVQNDAAYDVIVLSPTLMVNGFVMQSSVLQCEADAKSIGKGWLNLDETDLTYAQIDRIQTLDFQLDVCDAEYSTLFSTPMIHLGAVPYDSLPAPEFYGTTSLLYHQDGLQITYLHYVTDRPGNLEDGAFLFYLENTTDKTLEVFGTDVTVDGQAAEIYLYTQLPPGARAVSPAWLYDMKNPDSQEFPEELELCLEIRETGNYDHLITLEGLRVNLKKTLAQMEAEQP